MATEVATTREVTEVATTTIEVTEVATTTREVTEVATTTREVTEVATTTIAYIARPEDERCKWWSVQLPDEGLELTGGRLGVPFLRSGADLELAPGQMLIDSEANHPTKDRGYHVILGVAVEGREKVAWLEPTASRKAFIKANGGQDLMHESGAVAGCVRMAVWLRRQPDLEEAFGLLYRAKP